MSYLTQLGSGAGGGVTSITGDSGPTLTGALTIGGGTGITTSGAGSTLTVTLDTPVIVADGGTGVIVTTAYAVLCGGTTTTNPLQSIASVGTASQVLTSNGAGLLPTFQAAGSEFEDNTFRILDDGDNTKELAFEVSPVTTATTRTITMADRDVDLGDVAENFATDTTPAAPSGGIIFISGGTGLTTSGSGSTVTVLLDSPVVVANGGTGRVSHTAFAVICGGTGATTDQQSIASVGTASQVLTSNGAGALPTFQAAAGGGLTWAVTTVNASIVVNNGYIADKVGLLTMTLPASGAIGDIIEVTNINTAVGWRIDQNALQAIRFGSLLTTIGVGGYLEATVLGDSVRLVCTVSGTSTRWLVLSSLGNITVV